MSGGRFNLNDYVMVDERIDRFWARYPNGAIRTETIYTNNDGSSVAIRASVYKDWEHPHTNPDATGIAQELQGGANANKASWWENCETSAIGRALANLGMSISKQRPSREEMAKVRRYEDDDGNAASQPARTPAPPQTRSAPRYATEPPPQVQSPSPPAEPAAQAALPAAPPLTDAGYKKLFEDAWTMVEDGSTYLDVVAFVKGSRDRMTDAQFADSRDKVKLIRKAIETRDQAATPASYAG